MQNAKETQMTNTYEYAVEMLLDESLTANERAHWERVAMRAAMHSKGLSCFDGSKDTTDNMLMEHLPGYEKYSGKVVTETYQYAQKAYGKVDEETGEVIPATKLFNAAWNLKKAEIGLEKLNEDKGMDQAVADAAVRFFIREEAKKAGIKGIELKFNVKNKEKVAKYMAEKGFGEEVIQAAKALIENTYVNSDSVSLTDDDGEEGSTVLSDLAVYQNKQQATSTVNAMLDALYGAYKNAKTPRLKAHLQYLVTYYMHVMPVNGDMHVAMELQGLQDVNFLHFLKTSKGFKDAAEAIEAYTGNKRETVLKSMTAARALLAA